jgi:hypothetical protein
MNRRVNNVNKRFNCFIIGLGLRIKIKFDKFRLII